LPGGRGFAAVYRETAVRGSDHGPAGLHADERGVDGISQHDVDACDRVGCDRSSSGPPSMGSITWIDRDHFGLAIIDNGDPRTRGMERHYSRL